MHRNRRRRIRRGHACRLTLSYRCHEWPCERYPLSACLSLCFVLRCRSKIYISLFFVNILRIKAFDHYCGFRVLLFFPFFVHAFCMRMLNSAHDEIGNRSFACWCCFDCLKLPYKPTVQKLCARVTVGKRFAVVRAPKPYA